MRRRAFLATVVGLLGLAAVLAWPRGERQVEQHLSQMVNRITGRAEVVALDAVSCQQDAFSWTQLRSSFRCSLQTSCGEPADVVMFADAWRGVYHAGDSLAAVLFRRCPDMLPEDVQQAQAAKVDQGG